MIAIGDVHGCFKTLEALIQKLPKDSEIIFTGDVIDRGRNSKEIIDLIIENDYKMVLGNHEDMLLQFLATEGHRENYLIYEWWTDNGGDETIKSFNHGDDLKKYETFFKELPLYIEYTRSDGQNFIISHSTVNNIWNVKDKWQLFREECLWNVDYEESCKEWPKNTTNVVGHLIHKEHKFYREKDIFAIDTGCWGDSSGKLTALNLDTGTIYQQDNIE
jgi:serine/threonine protein phosphatase 1